MSMLFFALHLSASAQLQGKIEILPDNTTYQVSVMPSADWAPPLSITNSAQFTLKVPAGGFSLANFQSITGLWSNSVYISAPSENPGFDYLAFKLDAPLSNLTYVSGSEIILFTFENADLCTGPIEIIDNGSDPFMPPNSLSVNIGNQFTIIGAGFGVNAYSGNASIASAPCENVAPLGFTSLAAQNPLPCFDGVTVMTVNISGGKEPYEVVLQNTITGATIVETVNDADGTIDILDIGAGDYEIGIVDFFGTVAQGFATISAPNEIQFDLAMVEATCDGSADGIIAVSNPTGGSVTTDYDYTWSNGNDTEVAQNLDLGWHYVTLTDDNGCEKTDSTEVTTSGSMILTAATIDDVSCAGLADGSAIVDITGDNAPFSIDWANSSANDVAISDLEAGTYYYTVTDATGVCNRTDSVVIESPLELSVSLVAQGPDCNGLGSSFINIDDVQNGTAPYVYALNGNPFSTTPAFQNLQAGESYEITIQDNNGCETTESAIIPNPQGIQVDLGEDMVVELGEPFYLDPVISTTGTMAYQWNTADGIECDTCANPEFLPLSEGYYELVVTDQFGCEGRDDIIIEVDSRRDVYIPNAFSPNGDGLNDNLTVFGGKEIATVARMEVYDRWGNQVFLVDEAFAANDQGMGWDGTFRGQMENHSNFRERLT